MRISVVGLGRLGTPLAAVLASKGHQVIGVDVNADTVAKVNAGTAPVREPHLQSRLDATEGRLTATTDFNEATPNTDISFVIVPTPSGSDGRFTNRYVLDAVTRIGHALRKTERYHVVNITSTVMPGSTGGEIKEALEAASGRIVGENIGLTYNPEFIALGTVVRDLLRPDVVLIGESDPRAGDVLASVYATTVESNPPVQRMNWINAEITKLSVNTFVTTKISYANMLAELCEKLPGADVDVVAQALGQDSRIGSKYIRGALGYGGPCFPRDNIAWSVLATSIGASADIAQATDAINRRQVDRVVALIRGALSQDSKIAVLGMSYKPDTPVVEESQGVFIAQRLSELGHIVAVADSHALDNAMMILGERVIAFSDPASAIAFADVVVVANPTQEYAALTADIFARESRPRIVVDCWRILSPEIAKVAVVRHLGRGPSETLCD